MSFTITFFNNDDLQMLNEELKVAKDSIFRNSLKKYKLKEQEKTPGIKKSTSNKRIIDNLIENTKCSIKDILWITKNGLEKCLN